MPNPTEFLAGFDLIPHTPFGNYELTKATATHQTIKRYQEYEYQITLVFKGHPDYTDRDYETLFHAVIETIQQEPIVYGIRNPYRCTIDHPSPGSITGTFGGPITFKLKGHSYRI